MEPAANILNAFLASVGACFAQYPIGTYIGIACAMLLAACVTTMKKVA